MEWGMAAGRALAVRMQEGVGAMAVLAQLVRAEPRWSREEAAVHLVTGD